MTDFWIKRGDRLPSFAASLTDALGSPVDLTSSTVEFVMSASPGGGPPILNAAATIVSATAGTVRYDWGIGDTATVGDFIVEWEITFPSAKKQTLPTGSYNTITVSPTLVIPPTTVVAVSFVGATAAVRPVTVSAVSSVTVAATAVVGTVAVRSVTVSAAGSVTVAAAAVVGTAAVRPVTVSAAGSATVAAAAVVGTAVVRPVTVSAGGGIGASVTAIAVAGTATIPSGIESVSTSTYGSGTYGGNLYG